MATVVSGTWQFGYGDQFAEGALKRLPLLPALDCTASRA